MKNYITYGKPPYHIVIVHGGPGARGEMAPVARQISSYCGALELLQTATSLEGHIRELKSTIEKQGNTPAILIGYSFGAWLIYILASRYPILVKKLILINSGPFEEKYAKDEFYRVLKKELLS